MLTRVAPGLIGLACGLWIALAPVTALGQSNVELAAELGGRIVGAARSCGIRPDRIRRTSDRLLAVIGASTATLPERDAAKGYFTSAQAAGAEEVRSERSKCQSIHVSFSEIEVKLGRAPIEPLATKHGVPATVELKPHVAPATRKQ